VQQGVVEMQGFQCAFCMSGFIMATVGFLKVNPNPSRAELAHGISGNLCRCQDYEKILTAFMHSADLSRGVSHA
jgi:aerobic-type carbon monoxide dehydrogenase small subunit (CoxS/CutS family)